MGLLQNGYRDKIGVFRIYGAGTLNGAYPYTLVANRHLTGMGRNITAGEGITSELVGIPMGHNAPSAWMLPQKPGRITSFTTCKGVSTVSGSAAAGIGISGQSDGQCTVVSSGVSVYWTTGSSSGLSAASCSVVGLAPIVGESFGSSDITGLLFASVNINGQADGLSDAYVSGSLAVSIDGYAAGLCTIEGSMAGTLEMSGTAEGQSDISGDLVGAYFCSGTLVGVCSASGGILDGIGWLEGTVAGVSTLSVRPFADGFMSGSTGVQEQDGIDLNALADAVVSALNSTTIPVDTKKINGVTISGEGSAASPWGPA